jgi:hypothetical protein
MYPLEDEVSQAHKTGATDHRGSFDRERSIEEQISPPTLSERRCADSLKESGKNV